MKSFSSLMGSQNILPIIQADSVTQGVNIAQAMFDSGLKLVEVVLRTEASMDALIAITRTIPNLLVGAGTITNKNVLQHSLDAGADFIVTPAVSAKLLGYLADCAVPVLPGVSNTGEIMMAKEFGFTDLKLFPASLSGGAPFLSAISSIFKELKFCPTGGVTQSNKGDYLSLENVFAVGGTWMARKDWVENENWQTVVKACKLAQQ